MPRGARNSVLFSINPWFPSISINSFQRIVEFRPKSVETESMSCFWYNVEIGECRSSKRDVNLGDTIVLFYRLFSITIVSIAMPRVHHLRGPRALLFLACFTVTVLAATLTPEQLRSKTALLPARSFTHTLHSRTPPEQLRSKTVLFLARSFTRTLPSRTPPNCKTVSLRARSSTRPSRLDHPR
jgi:hypothetical protein